MSRPAPTLITAECFPTPDVVLRSNEPTAQRIVREFADRQAEAALSLHRMLTEVLPTARDISARATAFSTAFEAAEDWRYRTAVANPHPSGRYDAASAEQFRTPITDDNPNLFRIGEHERFRDGATWDPATRTYLGGAETPASRTMRRIAALITERFTQWPGVDVVCNRVTLPDGHGQAAHGMRLLRGSAAHNAAAVMVARVAARGGDTSRIVTDGQLVYSASSPETDRRAIFRSAMTLLAQDHRTPAAALTAWLQAAYLLYQAPRTKRGSDAATRTFLIAAGTHLLSRPPVLLHDVDLRAYVQPQDHFMTELRAAQTGVQRMPSRETSRQRDTATHA
ncbi:hypothetical protein ACFXAF_01600 [Kitasatospora sp. NPDC059463]|uniref:hypothetical protein n=1 Tax=unclassified Kitasatospora TaxID=2633591 RepID=UPI003695A642